MQNLRTQNYTHLLTSLAARVEQLGSSTLSPDRKSRANALIVYEMWMGKIHFEVSNPTLAEDFARTAKFLFDEASFLGPLNLAPGLDTPFFAGARLLLNKRLACLIAYVENFEARLDLAATGEYEALRVVTTKGLAVAQDYEALRVVTAGGLAIMTDYAELILTPGTTARGCCPAAQEDFKDDCATHGCRKDRCA